MRLFYIPLISGLIILLAACRKQEKALEAIEAKYEQLDRQAEYVRVNQLPVAKKVGFLRPEDELVPPGMELKQIALIRHGEPDLNKTGGFSYEEAKKYLQDYDSVGILVPDEPFFLLEEEDEVLLYTSNLNRAKTTAAYLFGPDRDVVESDDFREFERSLDKRLIRMQLPLKYWTITARIEWLLGINREGIESFKEAKKRALAGAKKLNKDSADNSRIVLVAHGFLNRYIKKYLKDLGWEVVREGGSNYFATTILAKLQKKEDTKNYPVY